MVPNRNGVNAHRLCNLIDGDLGLAEQGLQDLVFRAFHGREYNAQG